MQLNYSKEGAQNIITEYAKKWHGHAVNPCSSNATTAHVVSLGQIQKIWTFGIDISHVFMFLALGKKASRVWPYFANTVGPRYLRNGIYRESNI